MKVRFKKEYAGDFGGHKLSYELVSDTLVDLVDEETGKWEVYMNTKILGHIPSYKLEPADGSEIPAIDVLVKLNQ